MCGCVTFQIDPLQFITNSLKALSQPIRYLKDPKYRITHLTNAINQLQAKSEDLKIRIKHGELDGENPTNQVLDWFAKVDVFKAQVFKIIDDYKDGRFRWCINRRAARSLVEIKEFGENFVFDVVTTKLPPRGVQEVPADLPPATMVNYFSQLQTALQDDESRIIGIWGMGGVGKTTLLSSLNNKLYGLSEAGESQKIFDYVIWAVGSKDYKVGKLQRDIAERLGLPLSEDRVIQARKIMDFLKNKSFVLLLDDLWNTVDFAELGIPHPFRVGATKQKVVFTTRLEAVCGQMQARPKIKIECLEEAEAWRLFQEKVGDETLQAHSRILSLARQVAQECDGLPLALVLIGSAMSTKKMPREWQNAITLLQKSRPYEIHGMDDMIFYKLKFSYDYLPDEIFRKCFLLCSLWPEDHSISKTDLIECWMGHGLVDERKFDNINEAYDSGYSLIGGLQAACLLEPGDNKEREVKMHDVVRDLALWIAADCGEKPNRFIVQSNLFACNDSHRDVQRISFVSSDISDTSLLPPDCSQLETLIVQRSNLFKSIVPGFFEKTRALTYLNLFNTKIRNLPEEIGLLCNLRYLNLSHTMIDSLPLQLGYLLQLRFLLLKELNSILIPSGMLDKLELLSVIDMTDTRCINPQELSMLRCHLKGVGIDLESIEDLHQLAQLPNVLIWRLALRELLELNNPLQLLSSSQLGSRNIRSSIQILKIENSKSLQEVSMESDEDDSDSDGAVGIQNWCLSRLEELTFRSLPNLQSIIWQGVRPAKMLPSLNVLTISGCHNLSNISWVIGLPSLEDLTVINCNEMQQIIDDRSEFARENRAGEAGPAFPSLRRLELWDLYGLRMFGGTYTFPSLEVLEVLKCPRLKTLPFGAEIAGKKLKQIIGWRQWWEELDMENNVRATLLPYFQQI